MSVCTDRGELTLGSLREKHAGTQMDASIIIGSIGALWALWFVLSGFIPPRECPILAGLARAFRADCRQEVLAEIRAAAAARDAADAEHREMARSGELNHLTNDVVAKSAAIRARRDAAAARVVELYNQIVDLEKAR